MTPQQTDNSSRVLSPQAAAHLLGITPELLFAYALHPPKRRRGDQTRLSYVGEPNQSGFRVQDLEQFDRFLWDKWSGSAEDRPDVPTYVVDYLKVECGGQCARCGKGYRLANAHIQPWAQSLSHHHHNLIRLCSGCHDEYDATHLIARQAMLELKQRLIARVRARLQAPFPTQQGVRAPNPSLRFVGREHELGLLVELVQSRRSISIEGPGGIGKTQLLLHALQRLPEPRAVLWIDLQPFGSVGDIEVALRAGLACASPSMAAQGLFQALDAAAVTVVFDGVEDLSTSAGDALTDYFQLLLSHTRSCQFLFTSQIELQTLELEERFTLAPLESEAGLLLLRCMVPSSFDDADADLLWLANFCDGHPLALTLVGGLLEHFKSVGTVKRRIEKHGATALDAPTRRRQTTSSSLRACLLVSYETLSDKQRQCLFLVAHSPAGYVDQTMKEDEAYDEDQVAADVAALRRWHLVDAVDWGGLLRLFMLSPIRAFVLSEWDGAPSDLRDDLRWHLTVGHTMQAIVLCERYVQGAQPGYGVWRFDQEFPNYLHTLRYAVRASQADPKFLEHIGALSATLMVYCFVRGLFDVGVSIMRAGADARLRQGQHQLAGPLLVQAIVLAKRARNLEGMQAAEAELNRIAANSTEPSLLGDAATGRGDVAFEEGRLDDAEHEFAAAEGHYRLALDAHGAVDEDRLRQMLALTIKMQGFINEHRRHISKAVAFYEQALELLDDEDLVNSGATLHQIANCLADQRIQKRSLLCYLAAANRFHALPVAEYLSNSLSEAGYLLVDWEQGQPDLSSVSQELLSAGLEDLANHVSQCASALAELPVQVHVDVNRKVFGLMALASFTPHNGCLAEWAAGLRETVIRPAVNGGLRQSVNPLFWIHLDLTLALAGSLSQAPPTLDGGHVVTSEEIQGYAMLCYKFYDWGWSALRVFDWLAAYLRRQRGINGCSAAALKVAAEATVENGEPFTIAGV
jgi:hypothetical protein